MSRVLITVVGPRRRANLAVPFECPINDLMSGLVERCGEDTNGHNGDGGGREWAISRSDARLLPPDRSLQDCGITDGAILYLRPASVGDSQPLDVPAVDGGRAPSRAWTRSVLPERPPLRARLSQVAHAVLSSGSAAPIAMAR